MPTLPLRLSGRICLVARKWLLYDMRQLILRRRDGVRSELYRRSEMLTFFG